MNPYPMLAAIQDLPYPLVKWSEDATSQEVDLLVTVRKPDGTHLHVRHVVPVDDLKRSDDPEGLLWRYRMQIVETFRRSHPETLPRGITGL
jgi:hypothetical protein